MSIIKEFREFAVQGNVVDMAVGIIIGGAFGTIVSSLVNDIIMPPVGLLLGGVDFTELFFVLGEGEFATLAAAQEAGAATINYGLFINNVISFIIVALAVFMMIRTINKIKREEAEIEPAAEAPAPTPEDIVLLREIRDSLKK